MTSVEGLYAAGDLVRGLNQIAVATGEAAIAATAMHNRLRRGGDNAPPSAGRPAGPGRAKSSNASGPRQVAAVSPKRKGPPAREAGPSVLDKA